MSENERIRVEEYEYGTGRLLSSYEIELPPEESERVRKRRRLDELKQIKKEDWTLKDLREIIELILYFMEK